MKLNRTRILKILTYAFLIVGALVSIVPFAYMLSTSLKTIGEAMGSRFLPSEAHFENYAVAWRVGNFPQYFWNSFKITGISLIGSVSVSILAAYGFARIKFPGRDLIFGNVAGRSWLDFSITDSKGHLITPITTAPAPRPVMIPAGQSHRMRVVVNNVYPMGQIGSYRVKASVSFPQINRVFQTKTVMVCSSKDETRTRTVKKCSMVQEEREQEYTVMVPQTVEEEVQVRVCRMVEQTVTVPACASGGCCKAKKCKRRCCGG